MRLVDTHNHLDFPDFDADRAALLQRSRALGVERQVVLDPQRCLLYTSPSPRDRQKSRMPSSA